LVDIPKETAIEGQPFKNQLKKLRSFLKKLGLSNLLGQGKFVLQTIHINNATLWSSLVFCASVRNRKQDTSFNQQVTMDTQMKGPLFIAPLGLEQIYRVSWGIELLENGGIWYYSIRM
jgi:hypothetical protein